MKNSSSQNPLSNRQPIDSIQQTIFNKLFRDLSVPSQYQNGLSRELSFLLRTISTEESQIEQLSKAYILEFLKGIDLNNQKEQSKSGVDQTGEGYSLFSKIIKGDDGKKAQVNLIYQISKAEFFNSYNILLLAKRNLSNTVKSLADIIKNDDELLKIYTANKAGLDIVNPNYQPQHLTEISSISAMIASDLSADFKKNPAEFSHLGINQEQLDEISRLTPQQINQQIQKGIEDKKQSRIENIEKTIEEDLIALLHIDNKTNDKRKNLLEQILETGKIKFDKEEVQIKVTKINDSQNDDQREILKKQNDQLIKDIKNDNRDNHQLIDEEAGQFDFASNSKFRTLGVIATMASRWAKRVRVRLKTDPVIDPAEGPNSPSQSLSANQLKPNTRFNTSENIK